MFPTNFTRLTLVFSSLAVSAANAQKIYWNGGQTIQRSNIDGTNIEDLVELSPSEVMQIAVDQSHSKIYWTQLNPNLIRRANLDGTSVETVLASPGPAGAIAIDEINGHIYWSNGSKIAFYVSRSDLDGQNVQDVLYTNNFEPMAIDLDVAGGKIYLLFGTCVFWRANLDGTQAEVYTPCQEHFVGIALALDLVDRKIYWTGLREGPSFSTGLFRSNLDGTGFEILTFPTADPIRVEVDPCNRRIYWSEWEDDQFQSISSARFDGTDPRSLSPATDVSDFELALPYFTPNQEPRCIPALSTKMAALLALLILCSGYIIHRRRLRGASYSSLAAALAAALLLTSLTGAQQAQASDLIAVFDPDETPLCIDSGRVSASGSGSDPVVIYSETLEFPGSPWLRLHFSEATLSGSRSSGNASFISVTGTQPGAVFC